MIPSSSCTPLTKPLPSSRRGQDNELLCAQACEVQAHHLGGLDYRLGLGMVFEKWVIIVVEYTCFIYFFLCPFLLYHFILYPCFFFDIILRTLGEK